MVRAGCAVVVVCLALPLIGPAPSSYADGEAVKYPAYHRVQPGESMWSIAHDFLERATGHEPTDLVTSHEVRQMRRLNKDKLHGSDQIYPGERLSLAPRSWDVPDGQDGWGTGFTYCANEHRPERSSPPHEGLTLSVRLLKPPADKRRYEGLRFTIRNRSDHTRRFSTSVEHGLLVPGDGSTSAVMHGDAIGISVWALKPGELVHVDGAVASVVCGDTRFLDRRLPSGRQLLVGIVPWRTSNNRSGDWVTTRTVRVVRD